MRSTMDMLHHCFSEVQEWREGGFKHGSLSGELGYTQAQLDGENGVIEVEMIVRSISGLLQHFEEHYVSNEFKEMSQ